MFLTCKTLSWGFPAYSNAILRAWTLNPALHTHILAAGHAEIHHSTINFPVDFAEKEFIKNPRRTGTICAVTDPLSRGCRAPAGNLCSPPFSRWASPSLPAASQICFRCTFLERVIWHVRRSLGFRTKVHLTKAPRKSGSLGSGPCFKGTTLGTTPDVSEVFRILLS